MQKLTTFIGRLALGCVFTLCLTSKLHAQTSLNATGGQSLRQMSDVQLNSFLDALDATPQLSADAIPKFGNFFSLAHPEWPPLPQNLGLSVWQMGGSDSFLLNDVNYNYSGQTSRRTMSAMSLDSPSGGPGDFSPADSPGDSPSDPPDISNYLKYMAQSFSVIDTNDAAANDTNLYNACMAFGDDTNTVPVLQIVQYQPGCLLLKASHFDYSAETRDFCVVVCDKLETPLFKNIDLYAPSNNIQNGGWLVQGSVPAWQVTDPMYLVVSNISTVYNAFFQAIPYSGPTVQLTGYDPYATVSNTIALQATITDLSGVTNESFEVTVDGLPARYSLGASNTIDLETPYNPNGLANIYLNTVNAARIYDTNDPPDNSKIFFSGSSSIPLDFENDTYLAFASDFCPPEIGTNNIYFVIDKEQDITATVSDPSNGQVVAAFSGHVPYPATIVIPWNFTEADGVTEYSNDTYVVSFTASDPTTLIITNTIDRSGVRPGAGCFLTYQEQDPNSLDGGDINNYLNQQADTWINQTLNSLYTDLYDSFSLTQYTTDQVGANRNHSACIALDSSHVSWADFLQPVLSNSIYSDFTLAQSHGSGATIGGGGYLASKFSPQDLNSWLLNYSPRKNWRLRKAALWTCYSGDLTATGPYPSFPVACGIRDAALQNTTYMRKNCGLFFGGLLPQINFGGQANATAQVAEALDQTWVCGENQYPGGCDPTYSFVWAVNATRGVYNPELDLADPRLFGLSRMIYSSTYDDDLQVLDFTHVKHPGGN